jgi:hypothetical protein
MTEASTIPKARKCFSFQNEQIAGTDYHLVKDFPTQVIIKQSDYEHCDKTSILDSAAKGKNYYDFNIQRPRGDYVKNYCKQQPNAERFNLEDTFDRSTYLSNVRRLGNRHFMGYANRSPELI